MLTRGRSITMARGALYPMNACVVVTFLCGLLGAPVSQETTTGNYVLVASYSSIYVFDANNMSSYYTISPSVPNIESRAFIALDYDPMTDRVFFFDYDNDFIGSVTLEGTDELLEARVDNSIIESIAIDPQARLLFYTDTLNKSIVRINIDQFIVNSTIIWTNVSQPMSIVLDTENRQLYWTDLSRLAIERATYDGQDREVIVNSGLFNPFGIAIDFRERILYWTDAGTGHISSASLNGANRQHVLTTSLTYLYAVDMFRDEFIYSDPAYSKLYSYNMTSGVERPILTGINWPYDVRVISRPTESVDGNWSGWTTWGDCSVTCGNGSQVRNRSCTDPPAAHGGDVCHGNSNEIQACSRNPCPGGIGTNCYNQADCSSTGAVCENNTCACSTVYDNRTDSCDTMFLFPYGPTVGDSSLVQGDDVCSEPIAFSPRIPAFEEYFTNVYVCSNGVVSFGKQYKTPSPSKDHTKLSNERILAPFYADSDTLNNGSVYYRSFDILRSWDELINNADVNELSKFISIYMKVSGFSPVFVLFATWDSVTPYQNTFIPAKQATFQLALVSDGESTFVLYIYPKGMLKWETNIMTPDVLIGYSFGQHVQYSHPFSYNWFALRMDEYARTGGIKGLLLKRLGDPIDRKENFPVKCLLWNRKNQYLNTTIREAERLMPECPCDVNSLELDPWWWSDWTSNGNTTCMHMWPTEEHTPYGKTCCYNLKTGLWINEMPYAGGLLLYHNSSHPADHEAFDINPRKWCCEKSNLCQYYYELHPMGNCYAASQYNLGLTWGDPHFRTLDRKEFTFNGLGEYTLLRIGTDTTGFELQARTNRFLNKDNLHSYATVFTAFAAIENTTGAQIHVELNEAKDGMVIYKNRQDVTNNFKLSGKSDISVTRGISASSEDTGSSVIISKKGDALTVLFPRSEVSFTINVRDQMLTLVLEVHQRYKNETLGLLGNFDENPDNDFITPNGTTLPGNMRDNETFFYGQLWEIDGASSAFVYRNGTTHTQHHDRNYVPKFLDDVEDVELLANATKQCGNNTSSLPCIYDFVFGGERIALGTLEEGLNEENNAYALAQVAPSLNGCEQRIFVKLGEQASCPIKTSNGSDIDVILGGNTQTTGLNSSVSTSTVTRTILVIKNNDVPVTLSVVATNSTNNKKSPPLNVRMLFCTNCNGHGVCLNEAREDERSTEYFQYAKCNCDAQHTGRDCEYVLDGCTVKPCFEGQDCTSLNVSQQIALDASYLCGDCPSGYAPNGGKCTDVDECLSMPSPCEQTCQNTDGSFQCICNAGFRIDPNNYTRCKDANECEEGTHTCSQVCDNSPGKFTCSCFSGFHFNTTSNACVLEDNNNTNACNAFNCTGTAGCTLDAGGSPYCFCLTGFEMKETEEERSCIDLDECSRNICPQDCVNTDGSYNCKCLSGFKLSDQNTCEECTFPFWGEECANICNCSDEGSATCNTAHGCICRAGWEGDTCKDDINECDSVRDACIGDRQQCTNVPGSYTCECQTGFQMNSTGTCIDIDECSSPLLNQCDQTCINTLGSYVCSCLEGFGHVDDWNCKDIDECEKNIHECEQICDNTPGGYQCFCSIGYKLRDDRRNCRQIENPCKEYLHQTCEHFCEITNSSHRCACRQGYGLSGNGHSCYDFDECSDGSHACSDEAECQNTEGSYLCVCPDGTKLENDKRTCSPCGNFHYGPNCSKMCTCVNGACDPVKGCICYTGWVGSQCNIDINECEQTIGCQDDNTTCVNSAGGYEYRCCLGYENSTGECIDKDECKNSGPSVCEQVCENTVGSYVCSCRQGFQQKNGRCEDIDECLRVSNCDQECENTIGSYRCSCRNGFYLDLTNRQSCVAEGKCNDDAKGVCGHLNADCVHTSLGNYTCVCRNGYGMDASGNCTDTDECKSSPCDHMCINVNGGFTCASNDSFSLQDDGVSCKACNDSFFGENCSQKCVCQTEQTARCDTMSGKCLCKTGWTGAACDIDIHECSLNNSICGSLSKCKNTNGSYICKCDPGFIKSADGQCLKCGGNTYGEGCRNTCQCNLANTKSCDNVNGSCDCFEGWTGYFCNDSVNECFKQDTCSLKPQSICVDTEGSYRCVCRSGYNEIDGVCKDNNECERGLHNCSQVCENTDGGYMCSCHPGYYGYWNNCTECEENTFGNNCSSECTCVRNNSDSCHKRSGVCFCKEDWTGHSCDYSVGSCGLEICRNQTNSKCVEIPNGFKCECLRGFVQGPYKCVKDADELQILSSEVKVKLSITLDITIQNDTDFGLNIVFEPYQQKVLKALYKLFREYTESEFTITISDIRKGSLIVDFAVIYDREDHNLQDAVTIVTFDLLAGKTIEYDGQNVSATTASFGPVQDRCDIFESLFGRCPDGEECVTERSRPLCRKIDGFISSRNLLITVGSVSGALLVVSLTIICIVYVRRTHLNYGSEKSQLDNDKIYISQVNAVAENNTMSSSTEDIPNNDLPRENQFDNVLIEKETTSTSASTDLDKEAQIEESSHEIIADA